MVFKRLLRFIFFGASLLLSLSACNTTRFLEVDEFLLRKNDIKFLDPGKVANKRKLKYELSKLYQQNPNSNFFFIPREYFYYKSTRPEDTTKFDRWVRRIIAEPPAIFDEQLTNTTVENMERLMQYRGFFNAKVFYDETVRGKKIDITYYIEPYFRQIVDSVFFLSRDPRVDTILQEIRNESYFQPGEQLEGLLYEKEKERITKYLRNHGFASFLPNYVAPLEADTSLRSGRANVYIEVLPPPGDSIHPVYRIGEIRVYPNYDPLIPEQELQDSLVAGVHFRDRQLEFEVKAQTIIENIYLRQGDLYRQEDFDKTNRALGALGVFRFVRIKQEVDSIHAGQLNFRIELTPTPKLEVGADFELNYTNRSTSTTSGDLIGISISPNFKYRNLLGGAELLLGSVSAGIEVNPSAIDNSRFWNTVDLRLKGELYIPRFLDYLRIWRGINKLNFNKKKKASGDDFYTLLEENAVTRISSSYNFLLLLDYYQYNLFNAYYGYDLTRSNTHRYLINHIAIDFLLPITKPAFDEIQDSNPFLARSFGQQLFVSFLFRDFSFLYNSRQNAFGESHFVGLSFETAGTEIWAANAIYNGISSRQDTFRLENTDFSQYVKAEIDLRYYREFNPQTNFAARFAAGIALPFGFTSDVPYVKQFFLGGPSSLRAWPARSLGPGGYQDTLFNVNTVANRLLFYQTGDIRMEFSLEYRFDLFWRFKGAIFLDGGNIWTLRNDPDRCGSQFLFSKPSTPCADNSLSLADAFYRQIALGGGLGIRLDLSYFILRVDMGIRLRNPFPLQRNSDGSYSEIDHWTDFSRWKLGDANFNIGLGYPF